MDDATPLPETLEPWERLSGEPNRWYARFERFRLAGPSRSLLGTVNAETAEKGGKRKTKVSGGWNQAAERWRWRERAEAWDESERQKARQVRAREIEEMNRRHVQESRALQNKAIERLKMLKTEELAPAELLRYLVEAAKLERTALGEPEAIAEQRLTGQGGGPIQFGLEETIEASRQLEAWTHDRLHRDGSGPLPPGNPQVR